jgi:hypothetical protein
MMVGNAPSFHGYRSALERFYQAYVAAPATAEPPSQKMPPILLKILDVLARQQKPGRVSVANALLDLSLKQRHLLQQAVDVALNDARHDLTRPVSLGSFSLSCSMTGHHYHASDIRRHALANAVMLNHDERLLVELAFDQDESLLDVTFAILRYSEIIDADERSKIQNVAEGLLAQRMTRASNVGRNEQCPCGSGKKFKKCHGK